MEESLADLRRQIDAADDAIVEALRTRMDLSSRVGSAKAGNGGTVYAPAREAEVIARVLEASDGRVPEAALAAIYSQ
ncbi:MAG TPA: chorismate mutase, partial [Chloroflexota bacterium]|nr:chorismate mutase [Chloroflexota bacterium]